MKEKLDWLARELLVGISLSSRRMHNHSPKSAIVATPIPLTIHHATEEGSPPYMRQMNKCIIYMVTVKSKHFLALSTIKSKYVALKCHGECQKSILFLDKTIYLRYFNTTRFHYSGEESVFFQSKAKLL